MNEDELSPSEMRNAFAILAYNRAALRISREGIHPGVSAALNGNGAEGEYCAMGYCRDALSGADGLGEMHGLFSKIKKSVKKVSKTAFKAVKKVADVHAQVGKQATKLLVPKVIREPVSAPLKKVEKAAKQLGSKIDDNKEKIALGAAVVAGAVYGGPAVASAFANMAGSGAAGTALNVSGMVLKQAAIQGLKGAAIGAVTAKITGQKVSTGAKYGAAAGAITGAVQGGMAAYDQYHPSTPPDADMMMTKDSQKAFEELDNMNLTDAQKAAAQQSILDNDPVYQTQLAKVNAAVANPKAATAEDTAKAAAMVKKPGFTDMMNDAIKSGVESKTGVKMETTNAKDLLRAGVAYTQSELQNNLQKKQAEQEQKQIDAQLKARQAANEQSFNTATNAATGSAVTQKSSLEKIAPVAVPVAIAILSSKLA